jgi:cytochrome P450
LLTTVNFISIVHEYCFGNKPNLLGDLDLANTRRTNLAVVLQSVKIKLHFGWIFDALQMLPASISARILPPGVKDMIAFRKDIRTQIDHVLAESKKPSAVAREEMLESLFTHLHDSPELPQAEKSAQRLEDEATLMTMAGTYSPMVSLATAHYHLLARPDIMSKLRAELVSNPSAVSATQLEKLPYLSAVIQEAHRLTFGLTGRNPRVCPDETLVYTQRTSESDNYNKHPYEIPPGTSISTSTLLVHTDESVFQDPWRFDPERWLATDHATLARRRRCMLSFMRGPRSCIGIHLTSAEMALLVATMARWDMQLFETTEQDVSFCHDYHVLCPRLGSKGVRVRVLGRVSNGE